jgi:hypothetical protein
VLADKFILQCFCTQPLPSIKTVSWKLPGVWAVKMESGLLLTDSRGQVIISGCKYIRNWPPEATPLTKPQLPPSSALETYSETWTDLFQRSQPHRLRERLRAQELVQTNSLRSLWSRKLSHQKGCVLRHFPHPMMSPTQLALCWSTKLSLFKVIHDSLAACEHQPLFLCFI